MTRDALSASRNAPALGGGEIVRGDGACSRRAAPASPSGKQGGRVRSGRRNLASTRARSTVTPKRGHELLEQNVELARELGWRLVGGGDSSCIDSRSTPSAWAASTRASSAWRKDSQSSASLPTARASWAVGPAIAAWAAAGRGDAERAGMLWGAIEAETGRVPSGSWESERPLYAARLERVVGPEFDQARTEGAGALARRSGRICARGKK